MEKLWWRELCGVADFYVEEDVWERFKSKYNTFWKCLSKHSTPLNVRWLSAQDIIDIEINLHDEDYSVNVKVWIKDLEGFINHMFEWYFFIEEKSDEEILKQELDKIADEVANALSFTAYAQFVY